MLIISGCENIGTTKYGEKSDTSPTWVNDILSRSSNLNELQGIWSYLSVFKYENSDCSGDAEVVNYLGTISYGINDATRSHSAIYSFSDFQDKINDYSLENFQSDCTAKEGVINSENNCELNIQESLQYYLIDGSGYCEVYAKEKESVTYCGSIIIDGATANISFTWNSDYSKLDVSGCKVIILTAN